MAKLHVKDEHVDPNDTTTAMTDVTSPTADLFGNQVVYTDRDDPYAGLNRAQRRKAMAVEARAERKARRGRN